MRTNVRREAAIVALTSNPNIKAAAASCGISEKTMYRWLKDEAFATQLNEAQRGLTKRIMQTIISKSEKAADTLECIMTNEEAPAPARVTAARSLLELSLRVVEITQILERIEALENRHCDR